MGWAIAAAVVLVLMFVGLFWGIRDIPPSGRSEDGAITKSGIVRSAWASVNAHFANRNKLGR